MKRLGVHTTELSSTHVDEIVKAQILEMVLRHKLSSKHTSWVAVEECTERRVVHDPVEVDSEGGDGPFMMDLHAVSPARSAAAACYP